MQKTKKLLAGFTLIEVLVVVSIVGILSAIIYVNFNDARNEARNRAWQTELKEVQLAIELYKSQNGTYPSPEVVCGTAEKADVSRTDTCALPIINNIAPDFIAELPAPTASSNSACSLVYEVDSGTAPTWYKLSAVNCLEVVDVSAGTQAKDELALCPETCTNCAGVTRNSTFINSSTFYETIAVYSAGGQCE
jgi:prepilin-type N-terminal cleavage/methylation domain-containing protein